MGKRDDKEILEERQRLAMHDASVWVETHKIVNEKGDPISFIKHQFLLDIYDDQSDNLVVEKAAQAGLSTLEILKNIRDAELHKMDIIYTLPTDSDTKIFVGGKVNRIINNNPHLGALTADKDTIEQKQIGQSMIYFRGTWSAKAAIMVTADRLVHDEKDSSKQDVIADYQARLQHSKYKQTHVFSHPSVVNSGVDIEWNLSDQKEWFIKCPHCGYRQYLTWDTEDEGKMSIDIKKKIFVCKKVGCRKELDWHARAKGEWIARYKDRKWSGYHISSLMFPWMTAKDIVDKHDEVLKGKQTIDFFYNKVLGLPYAGGGNSVSMDQILGNIREEENDYKGRIVIGVDTGVKLRYVIGNKQGLLGFGEMDDYSPDSKNKLRLNETLEYFLKKFPNSIMIIDQGGDIVGSRKLRAAYPGRVFLCFYATDRKSFQLLRWGTGDNSGSVIADRNRMMQLVIDEFRERRIGLYAGTANDWHDYWLHWSHIYREAKENGLGIMEYKWLRSSRDDWVHATVYWRIGINRFGGEGAVVGNDIQPEKNSYMVNPNKTVDFDPSEMFGKTNAQEEAWWADEDGDADWRNN